MENPTQSPDSPPAISDNVLKEKVSKMLQWNPRVGPTGNKHPRIAIFGESGSGKSSLINSLTWIAKYEENGAFVMTVPCSRIKGMGGGANTTRLRLIRIGNMEFLDTRGFKMGAHNLAEIKRVCSGKRNFITDMSWEEEDKHNRISEVFTVPGKRVDFVILIARAVNIEYQACQKAIKAIKDASGCIPLIIVTNKDQLNDEQEAEIHQQLTGLGASSAFFVTNYLIDGKGKYPTENDLDIHKHVDLCDALLYVQHEYDQHLEAILESETTSLEKFKMLVKCLLMLVLVISMIMFIFVCFSWYNDAFSWENILVTFHRTGKPKSEL